MATEVKSSGVAIVLSFFWTGLGQLYAGHIAMGLAMMAATPFIWAMSLFGGGLSALGALAFVGGTIQHSQTGDFSGAAAGGGVGLMGLLMAISAIAWWIWGMINAKKLCETFNSRTEPAPSADPAS